MRSMKPGGSSRATEVAGVDERQQDVHERGPGEEAVGKPKCRSQPPSAVADREEDHVVEEGKDHPREEVEDVAERLGAGPVGREGGAQQERQVNARQVELVCRPQRGREHERTGEPARDRAPDAHVAGDKVDMAPDGARSCPRLSSPLRDDLVALGQTVGAPQLCLPFATSLCPGLCEERGDRGGPSPVADRDLVG